MFSHCHQRCKDATTKYIVHGGETMHVGEPTHLVWSPHIWFVWAPHHVWDPSMYQVSRYPSIRVSRYQMARHPSTRYQQTTTFNFPRHMFPKVKRNFFIRTASQKSQRIDLRRGPACRRHLPSSKRDDSSTIMGEKTHWIQHSTSVRQNQHSEVAYPPQLWLRIL